MPIGIQCLMQHLVNWSHEVFSGLLVPFAYYTLQSLMWLQHWSGGGVSPAPPMEFTCDWVGACCTTLYAHEWLQCTMCKWGLKSWHICTNWFNGDWFSQPCPNPHGWPYDFVYGRPLYPNILHCMQLSGLVRCVCPLAHPFPILPLVPWWDNRLNEKAIVFETDQCVIITTSGLLVQ